VADDPLSDRKRTNEELYFQTKDRELIEQIRQRAKVQRELQKLGEKIGITDPELSRQLAELGFTPETVKLLPLVPALEMAWAEGGVTDAERKMVVDVARGRGIEEGSTADRQLADWLDRGPEEGVFRRAGRLISALFESGGRFELTPDDILKSCEAIAEASGGSIRDSARVVRGTCDAQSHRERDQEPPEVARVTLPCCLSSFKASLAAAEAPPLLHPRDVANGTFKRLTRNAGKPTLGLLVNSREERRDVVRNVH